MYWLISIKRSVTQEDEEIVFCRQMKRSKTVRQTIAEYLLGLQKGRDREDAKQNVCKTSRSSLDFDAFGKEWGVFVHVCVLREGWSISNASISIIWKHWEFAGWTVVKRSYKINQCIWPEAQELYGTTKYIRRKKYCDLDRRENQSIGISHIKVRKVFMQNYLHCTCVMSIIIICLGWYWYVHFCFWILDTKLTLNHKMALRQCYATVQWMGGMKIACRPTISLFNRYRVGYINDCGDMLIV